MSTDEYFWIIIGLSISCFIFTCLYIQDIAWFYFLDWLLISIVYVCYKYYQWQFVKCSKKYGYVSGQEVWENINSENFDFVTNYEVRT